MIQLRPFADQWVVLDAGQAVGSGPTPLEARQAALAAGAQPHLMEIGFVPPHPAAARIQRGLPLPPLLDRLRSLLAGERPTVYLVGGALRDALLGRRSHDLDFAIDGDAVRLARKVANTFKGDFYLLDAERGTARVLLPDAVLDFARLRGATLSQDLADRDFTINALALPLELCNSASLAAIIDPLGGMEDLAAGLIRATNPQSITSDPIRGLRAIRQANELGVTLETETRGLIGAGADLLPSTSSERIRDEFCRLLVGPVPADGLATLDELGLLRHILPELTSCHGVSQSAPHRHDVFKHTLSVVEALAHLTDWQAGETGNHDPASFQIAQEALAPYRGTLDAYLDTPTAGGRQRRMILMLAAALHDIGKPATRTVRPDGRIQFLRHEQVGAKTARKRANWLTLSSSEGRQIETLVYHHMRAAWLASDSSPLSRRAVYRFFRDCGPDGLGVCLLGLADGLGKGEAPDPADWGRRVETVVSLLDHYQHHYQETIAPPPLLGGKELMSALELPSGPEVGRLLKLIQEAQAAGEVASAQQALDLARAAHQETNQPE